MDERFIKLVKVTKNEDSFLIKVEVPFDPSRPIAPAFLVSVDNNVSVCMLHSLVHRARLVFAFETQDLNAEKLKIGEFYKFRQMFTPDQIEILHSNLELWQKEPFEPSDAVRIQLDKGWSGVKKAVSHDDANIKQGWDHEHCEICFATISHLTELNSGYRHQNNWICESCYGEYIKSGFGKKLGDKV